MEDLNINGKVKMLYIIMILQQHNLPLLGIGKRYE